ncbi:MULTISPECIES: AI-2E family transporter [Gemmobacter]|mgnify:CR=1 FL=1|uniref:AI-2E family transporter n=2 Tax=Gemmobacter TaxID=204456 RepID=A0ABQ3FCA2_9RHOB|nr:MULTISPECIES: AI-2E family transporter [Gemmobacter]PTX53139.1 putative PurR-regulated permease PerM [Gemmobacter caeni]TWJ05250.1 putative PurR-regulated permease PerM [Gemmobacter caeni]GHC17181.1 AI-2E family transporter [Gemmobacter nanjingensis]
MTKRIETRPLAVITAFAAVGLFALVVWMLYIAQGVLVPLAFATVVAFVLWTVVDWMSRVPGLRRLPLILRHGAVLALFVVAIFLLVATLRSNGEVLVQRLPAYSSNILGLVAELDARFEIDKHIPGGLSKIVTSNVDLQGVARQSLGALGSLGGLIVLILLYTSFLMLEYTGFVKKLHMAYPQGDRAAQLIALSTDINSRIGGFLAVKTVINIILGALSYFGLKIMGIELAGFWAIYIGVLNYTPYLGSAAGVVAPSLMALAQTGDLKHAFLTMAILSALQFIIGSLIEPHVMGRRINLSPMMVLVSLASWYSLWGLPGAVLAVPMTVIILAVLGAIPFTRPAAILLSNDGRIGEGRRD